MKFIEATIGILSALLSILSLISIIFVLFNPNKTIFLRWSELETKRRTYGAAFFLCTAVFFLFLLIFIADSDARFMSVCFMLLTAIGIYSMGRVLRTGIIPIKQAVPKDTTVKIGPDGMVEPQLANGGKKIFRKILIAVACIFIFIVVVGSMLPSKNQEKNSNKTVAVEPYIIAETKDISYQNHSRFTQKIVIKQGLSKKQVSDVANKAAKVLQDEKGTSDVTIWVHHDKDKKLSAYSVAMLSWNDKNGAFDPIVFDLGEKYFKKSPGARVSDEPNVSTEPSGTGDLKVSIKEQKNKSAKTEEIRITEKPIEWGKGHSIEAFTYSQMYIKNRLKSPSTAKFAGVGNSRVTRMSDGNTYRIFSYVDSQNSFGAMIRTRYIMKLIKNGPEDFDWKVLDVVTEP